MYFCRKSGVHELEEKLRTSVFEPGSWGRGAWKRVLVDPNWGGGELEVLVGSISETVARATSGHREWMGQLSGPPTDSEDKSGGRMPLSRLGGK